ncbi:phasin family protein [Bradyrhizobium sp. JYMT SZCCT0180]|uniref:phasin family protein n=1 Tax=Bradyrhizobium sp. JYMT SZCCT0180 TaxID=2807666 RepID=UPI001BA4D0D5|nr:phasin family protein [Bradyrhizobium sp. JYMT SZCCT0180]MBR1213910.1 phasin family protein [Bradyrhizobium sp. JYMT SZCCT0180]
MSTTHQGKSGGKPRQRNRKTDQQSRKSEQRPSPNLDPQNEAQIGPMVASPEVSMAMALPEVSAEMVSPEVSTDDTAAPAAVIGEVEQADVPSIIAVLPANEDPVSIQENPVSIQTIANAYRDYTRMSLQESGLLVEKLIGARSFDKAIEIQTEFARQAYLTFVAETQKICELYRELARQTFTSWGTMRPR